MSKIGKQPIIIPEGVEISLEDDFIQIKSGSSSMRIRILPGVKAALKDKELIFTLGNKNKQTVSNWGTMRALAQNAVKGSVENFSKQLILEGVGFRAAVEGNTLNLNLGYSHPIKFPIPEGIKISVEKNTLTVSGADKALVGETTAKIRSLRKPEPYKGKGFRYSDEQIRRKAGKKAVATTK